MSSVFRILGWILGVITAVGAGAYFFLYLARWEWHRGLIAGLIFVAAEIAIATAMILRTQQGKSATPDRQIRELPTQRYPTSVPRSPHDFRWLDAPGDRYGVFIPVLLSGGVIMSAVGWVIEKIAGSTSGESRGEAGLEKLGLPDGGLVPSDDEARAMRINQQDDRALRHLLGPYAQPERASQPGAGEQ